MPTDYEAVKAGAKDAVTEWLATSEGREAITAGARSAVLDWIELTGEGSGAVSWGAGRAVTDWIKADEPGFRRALAEAAANRRTP
ncbi:hypothetical protein QBA35_28945 [Streptomyces bottropensis]|uniref:Uncharacterized protein n=1 Tax=Streptomyces bottropensis TaxID=42235 RepID=A0ABU8AUE5_9ACTN